MGGNSQKKKIHHKRSVPKLEVPRSAKAEIMKITIKKYNEHLYAAMRANKVSDERTQKILTEAIGRF